MNKSESVVTSNSSLGNIGFHWFGPDSVIGIVRSDNRFTIHGDLWTIHIVPDEETGIPRFWVEDYDDKERE